MPDVVATDEFKGWYENLDEGQSVAVTRVVDQLEVAGVTLPFPLSSALNGTRYALRELRVKAQGHQLRVVYIFDVERQAVLLVGGDKTGDDRFYETIIPKAEAIWEQYAKEQGFVP